MEHESAMDFIINRMRSELPNNLRYHALLHTLDVIKSAKYIAEAENVTGDDLLILLTAAAYHDCGFMHTYAGHEEASCKVAEECLPGFGYNKMQIELIAEMIRSTKVPQQATSHLAMILCDADLDYLGRDSYDVISRTLLDELVMTGKKIDDKQWLSIQIKFLENHQYWTNYAKKNRAPQKAEVLARLKRDALQLKI